jgi:hypothetical protein
MTRAPKMRLTAALALVAAVAAACAPMPDPRGSGGTGSAAFNAADFDWSAREGQSSIVGRVDFSHEGRTFRCASSAALTPETPYTRARLRALYGSSDRAALPEAIVRARTVPDANADYRGYVRSERCDASGGFRFTGLPDGAWYLIAPVTADGEDRFVLMRRVETRGGRATTVTLN